jgi:UDP-2,3-diacylglucosamine hydrolase
MQAWFISDLHLKDLNERNSILLLRFLRSLAADQKTTHLFLLGDIFDLWIGNSDVFQKKFQSIVDAILELKKKGVEVVYFEGNHDVHVKNFWETKFSIPVYTEARVYQLGSYKVHLEHGDLINPDDKTYLRYRSFVRQPLLEYLSDVVPGKLLDEVGNLASRLSRQKSQGRRESQEEQIRQKIHSYAEKIFTEQPFDYMITGHMHVRDEYRVDQGPQSGLSINLGSWFEEPLALLLTESGHTWHEVRRP